MALLATPETAMIAAAAVVAGALIGGVIRDWVATRRTDVSQRQALRGALLGELNYWLGEFDPDGYQRYLDELRSGKHPQVSALCMTYPKAEFTIFDNMANEIKYLSAGEAEQIVYLYEEIRYLIHLNNTIIQAIHDGAKVADIIDHVEFLNTLIGKVGEKGKVALRELRTDK